MATVVTNINDNNTVTPAIVPQGGTGLASVAANSLLYGSGTNVLSTLATGSANNLLVSGPAWSGAGYPIFGSNTSSTSIILAVCTGTTVSAGTLVTATLPSTFALGAQIGLIGYGAGGWKIVAAGGTTIQYGVLTTSSGGAIASVNQYDNVVLMATVANTSWVVMTAVTAGFVVT